MKSTKTIIHDANLIPKEITEAIHKAYYRIKRKSEDEQDIIRATEVMARCKKTPELSEHSKHLWTERKAKIKAMGKAGRLASKSASKRSNAGKGPSEDITYHLLLTYQNFWLAKMRHPKSRKEFLDYADLMLTHQNFFMEKGRHPQNQKELLDYANSDWKIIDGTGEETRPLKRLKRAVDLYKRRKESDEYRRELDRIMASSPLLKALPKAR